MLAKIPIQELPVEDIEGLLESFDVVDQDSQYLVVNIDRADLIILQSQYDIELLP